MTELSFPVADLRTASTPTREGDRQFRIPIPPGWDQGRGAFGGLVLGALTAAMEACEGEPTRPLRSFTGAIAGPALVGEATIDVTPLRRGSGVSTWMATLTQSGEALAHATAVFGKTRTDDRVVAPPPAEIARPWRDVPVFPNAPPAGPGFARFMEYRTLGPPPFRGAPDSIAAGWIRPSAPLGCTRAADVVALADAWWPAPLGALSVYRPVATIAFTLQAFRTVIEGDAPLFHRGRVIASQDGYFVEHRELWTEHGELVSLNEQTLVWIR
jgi:hypothetical protein